MEGKDTKKKLIINASTLIILCIGLCVASFAAALLLLEVRDNTYQTGGIAIDLNGGEPVITEDEFLFEPGMTVEKEFYIQNNSTWDVYYKLWFTNVSGSLADALEVTVKDADGNILGQGVLSQLTPDNVPLVNDDTLAIDQKKTMKIIFHFPEEKGNIYQGDRTEFQLNAISVQTKNNPDKEYE
ncbi:MAG: hypothetical protein IJA01_04660 [Firmicutes bacterium]|nr:hypothetical protein [Bacillota bacterium]